MDVTLVAGIPPFVPAQVHRSALKAYLFFLHWVTQQCEAEAREAAPAAAAAGGRCSAVAALNNHIGFPVRCTVAAPGACALRHAFRTSSGSCSTWGVRRGRGQKRQQAAGGAWDWEALRPRVARALAGVSEVDLAQLYAPAPVEEPLVQLAMKFVSVVLVHWQRLRNFAGLHQLCSCQYAGKAAPHRQLISFVSCYWGPDDILCRHIQVESNS
jgi:non-SMC mitotic condensation complex subunit 1, N-term